MKKPLPQEPNELINLVQEQQKTINNLTSQVIELQHRLDKLLQILYGTKSEKQKKPQPDNDHQNQPVIPKSSKKTEPKTKNGRGTLPADLPREIIKHDIPEDKRHCRDCGYLCHQVGKVVTEQLDFKPAVFYVKEHRRYKYACRCCQQIFVADMPAQPIDKGLAGPGVLTEVLINKYQDAMPLYRQQLRFARHGLDITRSTLCDWVSQSAELLKPIVDTMKSDMLIPGKRIFTDDTPVPVLDKAKKVPRILADFGLILAVAKLSQCVLFTNTPPAAAKKRHKNFYLVLKATFKRMLTLVTMNYTKRVI